ncbi:histidine--tRNA ligase [Alicyclobacillus shizuokensis]|uniref:histidine--tRNA ligase n=1 Tax=Alicyclobacillus shizuokensis TaxID=392014 RepID=UPI00277D16AD|nr:histidine--tRNA ligase [Alicyclobacillus shizuokensis]
MTRTSTPVSVPRETCPGCEQVYGAGGNDTSENLSQRPVRSGPKDRRQAPVTRSKGSRAAPGLGLDGQTSGQQAGRLKQGGTAEGERFSSLPVDGGGRKAFFVAAMVRPPRGQDEFRKEGEDMLVQRPRGTSDILPATVGLWRQIEDVVRRTFAEYHYAEIRTPMFEHTELFARGVGETTDIVEKEMYTFEDRGGRSLTLRPEGTAGVIRAYVENKLYGQPGVAKLFYLGPMFRYEKPQKGRERQFHQYGCEVLGSDSPALDAEVVALHVYQLQELGVQGATAVLNSVGCPVCRPRHREQMLARLLPVKDQLCSDCQNRLERNPLRIFDCKNERCQRLLVEVGAPTILESLCADCEAHFASVRRYLEALGVPYRIDAHLVRGLDYYTRTAWEIKVEGFGTLGGGGRYNALVRELGGPETPGVGFGTGMERILLILSEQGGASPASRRDLDVYVAVADEQADVYAMRVLKTLREAGVRADRDYQGRSVKAQFKAADREGARLAVVVGSSEQAEQQVTVKDLASGEQSTIPLSELVAAVQKVEEASV